MGFSLERPKWARCQWLTPVILAIQEAESRRIVVRRSQLGETVHRTLSQKKSHHKKKSWWMAQGVGPEFKPQYQNKKRKERKSQVGLGL
jgi:hypothetical protein